MHTKINNLVSNQRGETLVGVIVAATILSIVVMAITSYMSSYDTLFKTYDRFYLLEKLLDENLTEIQAKNITALPNLNRCYLKTYNIKGRLISEGNASCTQTFTNQQQIYIRWRMEDQSEINATFNHAQYMKLPEFTDSIRQITLEALTWDKQSQNFKTLTLVFFKKI